MISITLNMTYKGQHLIDALLKVSNNPITQETDTILGKAYSIGQTSRRPYEQIALLADDNAHIYPHLDYHTFTVTEGQWEDAEGSEYTPLDVVDYMLIFARNLYIELLSSGGMPSSFDHLKFNSFVKLPNTNS